MLAHFRQRRLFGRRSFLGGERVECAVMGMREIEDGKFEAFLVDKSVDKRGLFIHR